jgi:hypothetical protein
MVAEDDSKPVAANVTIEDLRSAFERQLQGKIQGIAARSDAAEVVTVMVELLCFAEAWQWEHHLRVLEVMSEWFILGRDRNPNYYSHTFVKECMTH